MATGARKDRVWDAAAGRDPDREALAHRSRDRRRARPQHPAASTTASRATAGPDGLVTLTGTVPTQSLRREVELSCWTVPGVRSLHDNLIVGH